MYVREVARPFGDLRQPALFSGCRHGEIPRFLLRGSLHLLRIRHDVASLGRPLHVHVGRCRCQSIARHMPLSRRSSPEMHLLINFIVACLWLRFGQVSHLTCSSGAAARVFCGYHTHLLYSFVITDVPESDDVGFAFTCLTAAPVSKQCEAPARVPAQKPDSS